jgi:hypothetical protein
VSFGEVFWFGQHASGGAFIEVEQRLSVLDKGTDVVSLEHNFEEAGGGGLMF